MRLWYWTSFFTMIILFVINMVATPILNMEYSLPVHKTLYIDRNFTDDEFNFITAASIEWNLATNGLVMYDVVRLPHQNIDMNNSIIITVLSADFPEVIILDSQGQDITDLGYYHKYGNVSYIGLVPGRISDKNYQSVVMHELGHSLGLKHPKNLEDGIGTLMYPDINIGADHITNEDLLHFCELYHCDNKLHN